MNKAAYALLLLLILVSCSKKLTIIDQSLVDTGSLDMMAVNFNYFSMRSKLTLNDGDTKDATVLVRMKKDSIIWINLSGSLGIQGMRAILTTDSVKILDRVTKEYIEYSYLGLSDRLNFKVDFNLIQSLIMGNMPQATSVGDELDPEKEKFSIRQKRQGLNITNYINTNIMKPERIILKEEGKLNSLTFDYRTFEVTDNILFPMHVYAKLVYDLNGLVVEESFDIEHAKIEFSDKPIKFPFNVPNKYDKR